MRPLAIGAFVLVCSAASTACGVLAGLNDYGTGDGRDAATIDAGPANESSTPEDDGTVVDPDAPASDDAAPTPEAGEVDVETPINDSGLSADSKPVCSASSCANGCCNASGDCVGGKETAACGAGGGQCTDCSGSGQVCSSGACAAPKPDASAPPTCSANSCPGCGSLQTKCCTGSHVCGCEYYWPSSCQ